VLGALLIRRYDLVVWDSTGGKKTSETQRILDYAQPADEKTLLRALSNPHRRWNSLPVGAVGERARERHTLADAPVPREGYRKTFL
jgi:hypothetical protein